MSEPSDQEPGERAAGEPPLPPKRVEAAPAIWWWFVVLGLVITVWVLAMKYGRGPANSVTPTEAGVEALD